MTPSTSLQIRQSITESLPGAEVVVTAGSPGHVSISVSAEEFRDKTKLACQRLVYKAIAPLLSGERPLVHAVDRLETRAP